MSLVTGPAWLPEQIVLFVHMENFSLIDPTKMGERKLLSFVVLS